MFPTAYRSDLQFASLFAGCGGFDLGFVDEGFVSAGAYDCDTEAIATYSANIDGPAFIADLKTDVPQLTRVNRVDVLIAGPPCQGFSTAGARRIDDQRNHLLTLTGVWARRLRPRVMVVENVAGALAGEHARYWLDLNSILRHSGYRTHTLMLRATELGMGQLRKRVLLFAWDTGREIRFSLRRRNGTNLKEVLTKLTGTANHRPQLLKPGTIEWEIARHIAPGQKLSNVRGGKKAVPTWDIPEVFGAITDHERTVLELLRRLRRQNRQRDFGDADPVSIPRLHAALGNRFQRLIASLLRKGYLRDIDGAVDLVGTFNGKFRRMDWTRPSSTVDTRFGSPRYFLHPSQDRGFTVREAARIQGFPDWYRFASSDRVQYRLIGNAVPPPMGQAAARFVAQLLGRGE